jgi:hypothetical protein
VQAALVGGDFGIDLGVGALQVDVGDQGWATVAGAGDVEDLIAGLADQPVELGVDEVEAGGGAPMAEEPRLDVLGAQRLAQQRVVLQVDLGDGEVVGRLPVGDKAVQLGFAQLGHR